MAKATKLKSGNWRAQVGWTDAQGVKHRESFTASTKQEAEMLALKFKSDVDHFRSDDLTVREALENYINSNDAVLSPSTIKGYWSDYRCLAPLYGYKIRKISSQDIQNYISSISDNVSSKTIKNRYGLLRAALSFSGIEKNFRIHFPTAAKKSKEAPENEQIMQIYRESSDTLKIIIELAAFHGMRRGEIAALKYGDLKKNVLHIHSDIVKGPDGWIHKEVPKTSDSDRFITLSDRQVKMIGSGAADEYIFKMSPASIYKRFDRIRKKVGVNIRFHDLRVFYASSILSQGIPESVAKRSGGWSSTSSVMQNHYDKRIVSIEEAYNSKVNQYFDKMVSDN